MSTHRQISRICAAALALALAVTLLFLSGGLGVQAAQTRLGYEERLFDAGRVHTIDIIMDGWEDFLASCEDEEYAACALVIDGEAVSNAALRAKGNSSLSMVRSYGSQRYSFKVEFDHYEQGRSYHGLDKLSLNNIIQDNTYLKDFLAYRLMGEFGAAAPLCSFVFLTVNGEDWGLYLAVEGVEDSFLQRYGLSGQLYKPDSADMGGGRGNGAGFDMEDWEESVPDAENRPPDSDSQGNRTAPERPQGQEGPPGGGEPPDFSGGPGGGVMGGDDVSLIYSGSDPDSYPNIFDNAKTDPTGQDKKRLIAALKTLNTGEDPTQAVDVEAVIRYFVVHNFVCNFDSYTGSIIHNYYLYEEGGVLSMIPWDYNLAFGGFQSGAEAGALVNYPIDEPVSGGSVEDRPMLAWIFASQEHTRLYHQYFQEFLTQVFESGWFVRLFDQTVELIAPYVRRDPTKFCTDEEFELGTETLRQFCLLRAESVSGQLAGTIPADSQGQRENPDALVDASEVELSRMGSMNAGGMGGGPGGDREQRRGEGQTQPPPQYGLPETPEGGSGPENRSGPADRSGPEGTGGAGNLPLLAASLAVLALGLAAAMLYKR